MKKNIAIIMGGYSSEYKISLESGKAVFDILDKNKFNCFRVVILKDKWFYINSKNRETAINKESFTFKLNNKLIQFDCVFNAIHGSPGEDGEIQSYFEKLNIPVTGSGVFQSKITYDKIECLDYLKKFNIKSADSISLNINDKIDVKEIIKKVGLPCFVKACKSGSSYGISKVYKSEEFDKAIKIAFNEGSKIMIESFLNGTEVSVGVINFKGDIICLPITEIVSQNDFFDYDAKYMGKSSEITPARISDKMKSIVIKESLKIYKSLGLKGLSRSEFIFKNEIPYLLEVNTVPGLTKESILPQQVKLANISLNDLYESLINEALN
jgi:D-alanine-D-alanine ligase